MSDYKLLPGVPPEDHQQRGGSWNMTSYAGRSTGGNNRMNLAAQQQQLTSITALPVPWSQEAALLDNCQAEFERISNELRELRLLIQQSTQEVETLNQRKVLVLANLHEMEGHLEHYSRQDIRVAYIEASEAEMRAFMLSEQREQWLAKAQMYERYLHFLDRVIEVLPLVGPPEPPGFMEPPSSLPAFPPMAQLPPPAVALPWEQMAAIPVNDVSQQFTTRLPPEQAADLLFTTPRQPAFLQAPTERLTGFTGSSPLAQRIEGQSNLERAIEAEEYMRQRVALQIHDGPAQAMANVVLAAEYCETLMATEPQHVMEELAQLKRTVKVTLQETRKLIFDLHPMTLADLGLVDTLKRYGQEIAQRTRVQVPVDVPAVEPALPMEKRIAIFRVVQEAVTNALEHSRTTFIHIVLAPSPEGLVLVVEDTGTGFDVDAALKSAKAHQIAGLLRMQERAEMLGGWLRIESAYERGTKVQLNIPL